MTDVVIIGAGPAGMTAAIYAVRSGLSVYLIEAEMYGGQMTSTSEIENYPATGKIAGWQLAQNMYEHISSVGISVNFENALEISKKDDIFIVKITKGEHEAKAVIIATGARRRKLGIPGENELQGKGVSYCAVCDGAFFKDKTACVIGGGNTALEDAEYLSKMCSKVYLIHRRDEFRGEKHLADSVVSNEKIEIIYSAEPLEIKGEQRVSSITLKSKKDDSVFSLDTDAVFVAIGLEPQSSAFSGIVSTDKAGYIIASEDCKTATPGIFAAGDIRTKALRQIITAASDGAIAAKQASEYIGHLGVI